MRKLHLEQVCESCARWKHVCLLCIDELRHGVVVVDHTWVAFELYPSFIQL